MTFIRLLLFCDPLLPGNANKVAEAQRAKRAERESLTTESRMRGRPKSEEPKPKAKAMGPPRQLSEEEKARRQERQVRQAEAGEYNTARQEKRTKHTPSTIYAALKLHTAARSFSGRQL